MRKRWLAAVLAALLCATFLAGCKTRDTSGAPLYAGEPGEYWTEGLTTSGETVEGWSGEPVADASLTHETLPPEVLEQRASEIVEIKEKMFVAQSNDIYLNPEDYLGKTVRYEGLMKSLVDGGTQEELFFVVRYGPGCCGYDSEAGFEVRWPEGAGQDWPEMDSWVKVEGVLDTYDLNGWMMLYLRVTSIEVSEETRGAEYVYQ